jgi:hypothetical protein
MVMAKAGRSVRQLVFAALITLAMATLSRAAVFPDPVITSVSPPSVFQNGASFTLVLGGTDFTTGGSPTVYFTPPGGSATSLTIVGVPTATSVSATVPDSLLTTAGDAHIQVESGGNYSNTVSFTIVPQPVVGSISPTFANAGANGFTLTVNGSGFVPAASGTPGTLVRFPSPSMPYTPTGDALPTAFVSSTQLTASVPGADSTLTRGDLARVAILSQLTESEITAFLNKTGEIFCSFADVACPGSSGTVTDSTGVTGNWRYIEAMYRLGYDVGCQGPSDSLRKFCPTMHIDLLSTPGTSAVRTTNAIDPPSTTVLLDSNSVDFDILPPPVPATSRAGALGLIAALLLVGVLALRGRCLP